MQMPFPPNRVCLYREFRPHTPAETLPEELRSTNLIAQLFKNGEAPKLTPEQIESHLAANRRNVESLVAAFRATKDRAFLEGPRRDFPTIPVLTSIDWPLHCTEDAPSRRTSSISEAFKQSAPDKRMAKLPPSLTSKPGTPIRPSRSHGGFVAIAS